MLDEIRIENLLLIERVHLRLAPSLNVFTGETGAGKSLLIDALGFLFGGRGDPAWVRAGASQAEVSARFLLNDPALVAALEEQLGLVFERIEGPEKSMEAAREPEPGRELIVSRILPRSKRARAYANGRPIAVEVLRHLGESLIDIHGQHENQSLLRPATRLEILDRFAEASAEKEAVREAYAQARAQARAWAELREAARDRQGREDLYRFQCQELEEARLEALTPEVLDEELSLLRGAGRLQEAGLAAAERLDGETAPSATSALAGALREAELLKELGGRGAAIASRLESLLAETRELAREVQDLAERARCDPQRLEELETIRAHWRALERKYGRDHDGLIQLHRELTQKHQDLAHLELRTEETEKAMEAAAVELRKTAAKLTQKRAASARELERAVQAELGDLGLRGAIFRIELAPGTESSAAPPDEAPRGLPPGISPSGAESLNLLFSSNPGLPPRPLEVCASGGELSRVMLALKTVLARKAGADRLPVVIFDEIDSGVGGRMGSILGQKLAHLAGVRQVLCVTHLPQAAAFGSAHFRVVKEKTQQTSRVFLHELSGEERIEELALMLRGSSATEMTRGEAREILASAQAMAGKPNIHPLSTPKKKCAANKA